MPRSQIPTEPQLRTPHGISPLKDPYLEGMILDVHRQVVRSPGAGGTPFGAAHDTKTPSRSSRRSQSRTPRRTVNVLERALRRVDHAQRRRPPLAFPFGVIKKFGDDRGGLLCAMLAFYGFLSIFPLLLLLVTVLGFAGGGPTPWHRIESSAFSYFPIVV